MAKRKKSSAPKETPADKKAPEAGPQDDVIDGEVIDESGGKAGGDFFSKIGDTFRSAGATAATYTRVGLKMAELEKLRLELRVAYSKLGESVTRCWDAAPDIGVAPGDAGVKAQTKAVNDLRRKIRETEIKIRELNKN